MSGAHSFPFKFAIAPVEINDPGTGNAIPVDRSPQVVPFTIAANATETNTLAAPVGPNYELLLTSPSVGSSGVRTVTVSSGLNQDADTTLVFQTANDWALLHSVPVGSGTYKWRVVSSEGVTGAGLTDLMVDSLTIGTTLVEATGAEINAVADASGRIINVPAASTELAITAALHADRLVLLPIITGAGLTITLPAATGTGNRYKVVNNGVQTVSVTVTALAGDLMLGKAVGHHLTAGASDLFYPDGSDDIKYTMNVTTTGGDGGDILEFVDVATDRWFTDIVFTGSGTLDTGYA